MLQKAKSNKLFCNNCGCKINKGDEIEIEYSNYGVVIMVVCRNCAEINNDVYADDDHIYSSDALGQL